MFGLKTVAPTFQMLMDATMEETKIEGIFSYQDDIIVGANFFKKKKKKHVDKLKHLFQILEKYNLTLALYKCSFHKSEVNCLCFHIANGVIEPISSNITKITLSSF